ncbi:MULTISPECIES: hypothetical protein [unclassified Streptomyces]|uniref:hypothetical protein n=1 Tax=unclassified Streptomyces TaxID=2593676 RepID=UPI003D8B0018
MPDPVSTGISCEVIDYEDGRIQSAVPPLEHRGPTRHPTTLVRDLVAIPGSSCIPPE